MQFFRYNIDIKNTDKVKLWQDSSVLIYRYKEYGQSEGVAFIFVIEWNVLNYYTHKQK